MSSLSLMQYSTLPLYCKSGHICDINECPYLSSHQVLLIEIISWLDLTQGNHSEHNRIEKWRLVPTWITIWNPESVPGSSEPTEFPTPSWAAPGVISWSHSQQVLHLTLRANSGPVWVCPPHLKSPWISTHHSILSLETPAGIQYSPEHFGLPLGAPRSLWVPTPIPFPEHTAVSIL